MIRNTGASLEPEPIAEDPRRDQFDAGEFDLIRQAVVMSFDSGCDCEIEQFLGVGASPRRRRRVSVHMDRAGLDGVVSVHCTLEREGDLLPGFTARLAHTPAGAEVFDAKTEIANAFTAIFLHGEALRRDAQSLDKADMTSSIEHLIANTRRAWQNVSLIGLARPEAAE